MLQRLVDLKNTLNTSNLTCVIGNENHIIFTSKKGGIAPLLDFYKSLCNHNLNLYLADKVIGKGAVFMADLCNIKYVYTKVVSESAFKLSKSLGIEIYFEKKVPFIINRNKDGMCPIENAVLDINASKEAYSAIIEKLSILKNS